MKAKLGIFALGTLSAFLLDPVSGKKRRDKAQQLMVPVTQRLSRIKERSTANQSLNVTGMPSAVADAARAAVSNAREQAGSVSASVGSRFGRGSESDGDALREQSGAVESSTSHNGGGQAGAPATTDYRVEVAPRPIPDPIPEGETNDPTLVARVESELFRDETLPKGKLNIDAVNGSVTVRGSLDDNALADEIVERIGGVEGVARVVDLLHRN